MLRMLRLAVCVGATLSLASAPSRYAVRTWGVGQGLPQSSVTDIAQDERGFLWLSTFGGLVRFDGRQFERLDARTPDFDGLRFVSVACDGTTLWAGTDDGRLLRFEAFGRAPPREVTLLPQLPHEPLWRLVVTPRGLLIAGGAAGTLRLEPTGARRLDPRPARTVVVDARGRVWSGGEAELRCVEGDCPAPLEAPPHLLEARTDGDAFVLSSATQTVRVTADGRRETFEGVRAQLDDLTRGVRWLVHPDGLSVEHEGRTERLELPEALRSLSARVLFLDARGVPWIGTDGNGLVSVVDRGAFTVALPGAPTHRSLTTVLALDDGQALVAGYCNGLLRYVPRDEPHLERVAGVPEDECVASLARDADGTLYFNGAGALFRQHPGQAPQQVLTLEPGLEVHTILLEGATAWLGTSAGLAEVSLTGTPRVVRWLRAADGLRDERVFALARGPRGGLLLGTGDGLLRLAGGTLEGGWLPESARPVAVRDVAVEPDGALWLATYGGGLAFTEPGAGPPWNPRWLDAAHGFCSDELSVTLRHEGAFWFNSNQGVFRVRAEALEAVRGGAALPACERFETGEGNGGAQPAAAVLSDGALAFPTVSGLAVVDPRFVPPPDVTPLYVTQAAVDDTPLQPGPLVEVPPGARSLHVRLSAPSFSSSLGPVVEHALLHDDEVLRQRGELVSDWVHLPPGDYVYEARRVGRDGNRGPPLQLRFRLSPAPWERRGLQALAALLVLALGLLVVRTRDRKTQARAAALERQLDEQARAERAGRERDAVQRTLFLESPAALLLFEGHRVAQPNATAERLLGVRAGDGAAFIGEGERAQFEAMLDAARRGEVVAARDFEGVRADGARCVLNAAVALLPRDGARSVLVALTDLTAEREAAAQRRELLERTAVAQRLEGLGRLAAGVAHDFNNVLAALLLQVADLEAGASPDSLAREMRGAIEMGRDLTRRFLFFGRGDPELVALPLDEALASRRAVLERLMPTGVTLAVQGEAAGCEVWCSTPLLDQLLLNLVVNARDAVGPGGHVRLVTSRTPASPDDALQVVPCPEGPVVELRVEDDGAGMDAAVLSRAFEPFFTTKQAQGTGVGLTVVQGIARAARAGLSLRSRPGEGTSVRLQLRVAQGAPTSAPPTPSPQGRPVVLICDDLEPLRRAVGRNFKRDGFEVLEAADGEEALAVLARTPVSLLLTDLNMPRLDGAALVTRLRERGETLPIIVLTGVEADGWARIPERWRAGVEVLEKPIDPQVLLAKARALLA